MAEQLAFDHRFGQGTTVEGHKIAFAATAPIVQQLCNHLFAAASFASHEHINIGIGYIPQRPAQVFHSGCLAD